MNKFKAMSAVLRNDVMKRSIAGDEWNFVNDRMVFATISKSNGKYFVHYVGRVEALKAYNTFMSAASIIANLYMNIVNTSNVAGGVELYNKNSIKAFLGTDGKVYTIDAQRSVLNEVQYNIYRHLKHYHADVISSDALLGTMSDDINNSYDKVVRDLY